MGVMAVLSSRCANAMQGARQASLGRKATEKAFSVATTSLDAAVIALGAGPSPRGCV